MGKDFPIRIDLMRMGIPERTIRVLEKAALIVETIERVTGTETSLDTVNGQIDTINESIEDANLSLTSLDGRLDTLEADAPYLPLAGGTLTGTLNVNDLLECDTFRLNTAPSAAVIASTHKVAVNINGSTYYILLSNV